MSEKQLKLLLKLTALYVQPGIQWRQKKKQSWILSYGSQQKCISIDMVESFPKNKVLGSVGGVFVCL